MACLATAGLRLPVYDGAPTEEEQPNTLAQYGLLNSWGRVPLHAPRL